MALSPHESDLAAGADAAVRPFHIDVPAGRHRRPPAPDRGHQVARAETVADDSQGVPLQTMQDLAALLGDGLRLARVRGAG